MTIPPELQLLFSQSPALALAFLIWYYSNKELLRLLEERREMIEEVAADRKEIIDTIRSERAETRDEMTQLLTSYRDELRLSTEAQVGLKSEIHALRNRLQVVITKVDTILLKLGLPNTKESSDE